MSSVLNSKILGMFPDTFGLLPLVSSRGKGDVYVKLANKRNINLITVPTSKQINRQPDGMPDEIQVVPSMANTVSAPVKRKPRKLLKSLN